MPLKGLFGTTLDPSPKKLDFDNHKNDPETPKSAQENQNGDLHHQKSDPETPQSAQENQNGMTFQVKFQHFS